MARIPYFTSPVADDHDLRALVLAGLVALGLHAPRRHRVAAPPRCGLRRRRAGGRSGSSPRRAPSGARRASARAPALPIDSQVVLVVADFADGRAAIDVHLADLARAQAQLRVRAFARQHLHARRRRSARAARPCRACISTQCTVGADRDVAQRQRVARLDRRLGSRHQLRADRDALRRDHVAALAVGVEQQREVRAAVRVVLEPLDLRRRCRPCCGGSRRCASAACGRRPGGAW